MRVGIAGAGAIAERAHLPALKLAPRVQVVAIQSRTADKAQRIAGAFWADSEASIRPRVYTDFEAMLQRERPDAVGIFTPNRFHCEFTLKALAAGSHVLVEKPMAPTVGEARRMIAAAEAAGRLLMVAMQQRYSGVINVIREAVSSGAIGRPHFIRARLSHGGPESWASGQNWFFRREEAGGGAMLDLGVHAADLALWMMGEAASVMGRVGRIRPGIDVEDHGAMLVEFRSGAIGAIEASWNSNPRLSVIEIHGTEGRVMSGYPRLDVAIQRADGSEVPGYSREEIMRRFDPHDLLAPSRSLISNFVAAIEGKSAPSPDGTDGMHAVELIEACYRSSDTGSRITLPLD